MALLESTRSGIDLNLAGVEGVDFWIEYFYSDQVVCDRALITCRGDTVQFLDNNDRNTARTSGNNYHNIPRYGADGVPNSGDEGIIRMQIDGDMSQGRYWAHWDSSRCWPSINTGATFTFDDLTYAVGTPAAGLTVVGRTGHNGSFLPKTSFYAYGQLDEYGREYHDIKVAHDDWGLQPTMTNDNVRREWHASDSKVWHYCVNSPLPCIKFETTGRALYHTSRHKAFGTPRVIGHLETVLWTGWGGTITCKMKVLGGEDVVYRINGGSWITHNAPELTAADFSTGTNLLEFYTAGSPGLVAKRTVLKDPPFPSAGESHGLLLPGNQDAIDQARDVRRTQEPYKYYWDRIAVMEKGHSDKGRRGEWNSRRRTRTRFPYTADGGAGIIDNVSALMVLGAAAIVASPEADRIAGKTYANFAKEMLLENSRTVDAVGWDGQQAGSALPCRDLYHRGYEDIAPDLQLAYGYDALIARFRTDIPGFEDKGICPVEDYYLRECVAAIVYSSMQEMGSYVGFTANVDTGGMWDVSRRCGAVVAMFAIPSYSSPLYGTCGLDGNTTTYAWCPYPDTPMTWKQALLDEDQPMTQFPNYCRRLGIANYNCLPNGKFADKSSYGNHMGRCFSHVANVLATHYPSKKIPEMDLFFENAAARNLYGTKANSNGGFGPSEFHFLAMVSNRFPGIAKISHPIVSVVTGEHSDNDLINGQFGTCFFRYDLNYGTTVPPTEPEEPAPPQTRRVMRSALAPHFAIPVMS